MKLFIVALTLTTFTSAYAMKLSCSPETGGGKEKVNLTINAKNLVSINVNGKGDVCGKGKVTKDTLVEYGEGELVIKCKKGTVKVIQDYDEMKLEVEALKLGLSDTTFICI